MGALSTQVVCAHDETSDRGIDISLRTLIDLGMQLNRLVGFGST